MKSHFYGYEVYTVLSKRLSGETRKANPIAQKTELGLLFMLYFIDRERNAKWRTGLMTAVPRNDLRKMQRDGLKTSDRTS